jgi:hypothetical protein
VTVAELIRTLTGFDADADVQFEDRDTRLPVREVVGSHRWARNGAVETRERVVVLKVGRR